MPLVTSGRVEIVDLISVDYLRVLALIRRYADLGLRFVDASIVAMAERLQVTTIATLNRRTLRRFSLIMSNPST